MLYFAAFILSKSQYGEFEFYKKTIELGAIFVSFGTPTLLLTYTKSFFDKVNLSVLSLFLALLVSLISWPMLAYFNLTLLYWPILVVACFYYANSIIQSFFVVALGSNYSAWYKIGLGLVLNVLVLYFLVSNPLPQLAYIHACQVGGVIAIVFIIYRFRKYAIQGLFRHIKSYTRIFVGLLYKSFTLVLNNFVNIAFLYTDIYVIKMLSESSLTNQLIADYVFPLNLTNALIIIPMTIAHVDVEKVKVNTSYFKKVVNRNRTFLSIAAFMLPVVYYLLLMLTEEKYAATWPIFFMLLCTKFFQGLGVPFGMMVIIKKAFNFNLLVNVLAFAMNLILSIYLFPLFQLTGIAIASLVSLLIRFLVLRNKVQRQLISGEL